VLLIESQKTTLEQKSAILTFGKVHTYDRFSAPLEEQHRFHKVARLWAIYSIVFLTTLKDHNAVARFLLEKEAMVQIYTVSETSAHLHA
jgi:hypothetical protein